MLGGDGSNSPWNNYDGGFRPIVTVVTSNTIAAERAWDTYYIAIGWLIKSLNLLLKVSRQAMPSKEPLIISYVHSTI